MKTKRKNTSVLVVFSNELPFKKQSLVQSCDTVVAPASLRKEIEESGGRWVDLQGFLEPGSIYEASSFAEELSCLSLPDGTRVTKSCMYKGYELWWIHYTDLFLKFCLPFTQCKKLLLFLKDFEEVCLYESPYNKNLFDCYLWDRDIHYMRRIKLRSPKRLPFGIVLQIILTLISLPIAMVQQKKIMVFTGDKFDGGNDYDFRMRYIYKELRDRDLPFIEFVRSLEPWRKVFVNALRRRRAVVYPTAVTFIARFLSIASGSRSSSMRMYGKELYGEVSEADKRFKLMLATRYLLTSGDDIWEIRIMRRILRLIGVEAACITATSERNYHTAIGCKLNAIPIIGILHGTQSRYYNLYDFMTTYDGEKSLSVDIFGVWSDWWREYYIKNSRAYTPEQIHVSGPMRPIQRVEIDSSKKVDKESLKLKVLFVSETVAVPSEVIPYLEALLGVKDFSVYLKFRTYHDIFQEWILKNRPDLLQRIGKENILNDSMYQAIEMTDVVVGSQSTGVIEATLLKKPFVFFSTEKWGDYFDMETFDERCHLFAHNQKELIQYIRESKNVPKEVLAEIATKFFGDPHKNGSAWVVDTLVDLMKNKTSN